MAAALHPQVERLVEDGRGWKASSLEELRAGYARTAAELGGPVEDVAAVEDLTIPRADRAGNPSGLGGELGARLYRPAACDDPAGCLVWLHGGGWCVGDLEGFDRVCRTLANAAHALVLSVDYRLAPEHPFPAPVHDADAALRWARGEGAGRCGHDPGRVAVGGDSAGGTLAAVAARHARDDGRPALRAQALVYPVTDAAMAGKSYSGSSPMLEAEQMRSCWAVYRADAPVAEDDPDLSPLAAPDLDGVAPALVLVAGHDVLRDDGVAYAAALRAAGVEVELADYEDMAHGFLRWGGAVDRGGEAVRQVARFARERLAA